MSSSRETAYLKFIERRKSNVFGVFIFNFLDSAGWGRRTTLRTPLQMNKLVSWKRHLLLGPEKKNFYFLRQAIFKLFSEIERNPKNSIFSTNSFCYGQPL
jgi:hypothetical protein